MKIISIYNNKGGVGKTTTTKYFAMYLAKLGKKVLLVDMDPQANLTSQFSVSDDTNEKNSNNLLLSDTSIKNLISKTDSDRVDIICSHLSLLEANNKMLLESVSKQCNTRLQNKLIECVDDYDYILIDCPPTMDLLITNALTASDSVIIPIGADSYSIDGISMLISKIEEVKNSFNNDLKIQKIFMNQYKHTNLHKSIHGMCKEHLEEFSDKVVGDYTIVKESTVSNDTKIDKHKITEQYTELFDEVLGACYE